MDNPFDKEEIEKIKEELQTNGAAAAAEKVNAYLKDQNKIQLNIGITGASGSGKSTFVNAFRGVNKKDKSDAAAPTGSLETTMEVESYTHPKYPNVTLWDLPGIGTTTFPADEYLQQVGFERFDFFIIISVDRFTENDVKLAKEIQSMEKHFYFVRSKIDHSIQDDEVSESNAESFLSNIRENYIQGLENQGVKSPKVFLVSSHHLHLYDFRLLQQTLERELPAHKRGSLLLAMPIVNLEIITKKKEALKSQIKFFAATSALGAALPIAGLSIAVDIAMLVPNAIHYKDTFGLDSMSLQSLADSTRVPLEDLIAEMKSPLALEKISVDVIYNMMSVSYFHVSLMAAEEVSRYVPLFGLPAAAALSFASTYNALSSFIDMLAEDAQRVFTKALRLK